MIYSVVFCVEAYTDNVLIVPLELEGAKLRL